MRKGKRELEPEPPEIAAKRFWIDFRKRHLKERLAPLVPKGQKRRFAALVKRFDQYQDIAEGWEYTLEGVAIEYILPRWDLMATPDSMGHTRKAFKRALKDELTKDEWGDIAFSRILDCFGAIPYSTSWVPRVSPCSRR